MHQEFYGEIHATPHSDVALVAGMRGATPTLSPHSPRAPSARGTPSRSPPMHATSSSSWASATNTHMLITSTLRVTTVCGLCAVLLVGTAVFTASTRRPGDAFARVVPGPRPNRDPNTNAFRPLGQNGLGGQGVLGSSRNSQLGPSSSHLPDNGKLEGLKNRRFDAASTLNRAIALNKRVGKRDHRTAEPRTGARAPLAAANGVESRDRSSSGGFREICRGNGPRKGVISPINLTGSMAVDTETPFVSMRGVVSKMCDARESKFVSDSKRPLDPNEFGTLKDGSYVFVTSTRLWRVLPLLKRHKHLVLFTGNAVYGTPNEVTSPGAHIPSVDWRGLLKNNVDVWVAHNFDLDVAKGAPPNGMAMGGKSTVPDELAGRFLQLPLGINFHTFRESQGVVGGKNKGFMRGKGGTTAEQSAALARVIASAVPFQQRRHVVYLPGMTEFKKRHNNDRGLCKKHFYYAGRNITVRQDKSTSREEHWKELAKYRFVASPMGMGMDCHRTYEVLALGSIPIVRRSPVTPLFESMAVAVVDSWDEVTPAALDAWAKRWPQGAPAEDASLDSWVCRIERRIRELRKGME